LTVLSNEAPRSISKNSNSILEKIKAFNSVDFFKPSSFLLKKQTNFFIHSASYVNLTTDSSQKSLIFKENLEFTIKIFNTFSSYIDKFSYISTAFCIGNIGGLIDNNYHNKIKSLYRNFYEESKHATEKFLLEEEKQKGIPVQILRPSVLGGNINSKPKYFISKYMVYYLLGKFFYKNPFNNNSIRIIANFDTGLNIIPVDYTAKVISKTYLKEIKQLNIVHSKSTNLKSGMSRALETVNFNDFTFVNAPNDNIIINDKNKLEKFYYSSIGLHLNPYLISKPYEFNTKLLESIIPMPKYNLEDYIEHTIEYAKKEGFRNKRW